jgi:hypothetical protein
MKFFKALFIMIAFTLVVTACKKESASNITYGKATLNGASEVPAVTTTALGTINYSYDPGGKVLSYTISYAGLTGNPTNNSATGSGIYGTASAGAVTTTLLQSITFPAATNGVVSGSLVVDGFAIKESNLLAGLYYVNIKTAANTGGEIRAQLTF